MGGLDGVTWQAAGLVLTLAGLGLSAVVWSRRGPAKGLRAVAWSLLPLAAGLTGVLRLGAEVAEAVLRWVTRLVFSPVVWLGLAVAAVSVALFVVSGWLLRRGHQHSGKPGRQTPGRRGALPGRATGAGRPATVGDDMDDVEEILRKHGIQ